MVINLRLPETYQAEAIINIGQKADAVIKLPLSYRIAEIPGNVRKSISVMYKQNEEYIKYDLKVEKASDTLVGVSVRGTDMRRAKEIIEEIVNRLRDDHFRITIDSLQLHKINFKRKMEQLQPVIETLKADIKMIQDDKSYVEKQMEGTQAEKANPMAMATLMDIRWARRKELRATKKKLFNAVSSFQGLENANKEITDLENLEKYKTKVVGGIKAGKASVRAKKKLFVPAAGVAGFTISFFLILFIECVRERGEGKKNSV